MWHFGPLLGCLLLIGQAQAQTPAPAPNASGPASGTPGAANKPVQTFDQLRRQIEQQRTKQPAGAASDSKALPVDPCVINAKLPQCELLK